MGGVQDVLRAGQCVNCGPTAMMKDYEESSAYHLAVLPGEKLHGLREKIRESCAGFPGGSHS